MDLGGRLNPQARTSKKQQHWNSASFETPPSRHVSGGRAAGPFTPSPFKGSSPGYSPYPPLSENHLKRLKDESKRTDSQVRLLSDVYTMLSGETPDHANLIDCLAAVLDSRPVSRTFSALTADDYLRLNPGESGLLICNYELLHDQIPDSYIPNDFWPSLQTLRETFSRRLEMGVRQIIGHFLAYAVKIARKRFDGSDRLVVQSEFDLPEVEVPEIGNVRGPLDYLTCSAAGKVPMGKCATIV